jgi:hypothetical protein
MWILYLILVIVLLVAFGAIMTRAILRGLRDIDHNVYDQADDWKNYDEDWRKYG